jgi:hypothetical protein
MSAAELAKVSKVGLRTIRRAELEEGALSLTEANKAALIAALEGRGVGFLQGPNGLSVGLRKA